MTKQHIHFRLFGKIGQHISDYYFSLGVLSLTFFLFFFHIHKNPPYFFISIKLNAYFQSTYPTPFSQNFLLSVHWRSIYDGRTEPKRNDDDSSDIYQFGTGETQRENWVSKETGEGEEVNQCHPPHIFSLHHHPILSFVFIIIVLIVTKFRLCVCVGEGLICYATRGLYIAVRQHV